MATGALARHVPRTAEELAGVLGEAGRTGRSLRICGAGTKARWGGEGRPVAGEVSTTALDGIVEHNAGDLTAVLLAGTPLAHAQEAFAASGQMLALDPPDGGATVGGVVATADSGPLRSRFGGPRDLVLGMRVALPDGSLAKTGGRVIKNVAGYDLAKLHTGALGTLGVIAEVSVRLHPLPPGTVTAIGAGGDPAALAAAAAALARAPLEQNGLDVRFEEGRGSLLVRLAGVSAARQAEAAGRLLREAALSVELVEDDEGIWVEQRERQRGGGIVARVSALPSRLAAVLAAADRHGARAVGRAGLGLVWLDIPDAGAGSIERLRRELHPSPCVVLSRPPGTELDPWGPVEPGALALMRRVKERFDPGGVCNPGVHVGGM